jgi:hypothetical protein
MSHFVAREQRHSAIDSRLAKDANRRRRQKWKIAWGEDEDVV